MFHIILYKPEIPPNTGNIIRLCANTGNTLHLIHPLGFVWEDKKLKRAGLDYHDLTTVHHHESLECCLSKLSDSRIFALSSKADTPYHAITYKEHDAFLFGPETTGLPKSVLDTFVQKQKLFIPQKTSSRSLNLSNSVSIMVYEAWRQLAFA